MARRLIVLPDDSSKPIVDAIRAAAKSLRIKMFVFSDPSLIAAVIAAQTRGVKVRVMLNPARRSGEAENQASRSELLKGKVAVEDSNPAFDLTHEKSMVVDDVSAFVSKQFGGLQAYAGSTTGNKGDFILELHLIFPTCLKKSWSQTPLPTTEMIYATGIEKILGNE